MYEIKAESARSFALTIEKYEDNSTRSLLNSFRWWSKALYLYTKFDDGEMTGICINSFILVLEKAHKIKEEFKRIYIEDYENFDEILERLAPIPEILIEEKKKINKMVAKIIEAKEEKLKAKAKVEKLPPKKKIRNRF